VSERTFRAVVAAALVGALALAVIVLVVVLLPRSPQPSPTAPLPTRTVGPSLEVTPSPTPGPAVSARTVVGVGRVPPGTASATTLELTFVETGIDAIADGPGSFTVTVTDQAGGGTTVRFVGTPSVAGPGSLGATAQLVAPNVLEIQIAGSDTLNIEPITVSGLGIGATATAAPGALNLVLGDFTGSLVGGPTTDVLATPGSVGGP
jgi:hypothetical protein